MYITLLFAVAFGWIAHSIYVDYTDSENKNSILFEESGIITALTSALTFSSSDIISPRNRIHEDEIHVYDTHVVLDVNDALWSTFTDTNSMDPVLDIGANGIEIVPHYPDDIHLGDIISYKTNDETIVVHRVIKILSDEEGIYYITKGDNNPVIDPVKIRFSDVQGILVAVVY